MTDKNKRMTLKGLLGTPVVLTRLDTCLGALISSLTAFGCESETGVSVQPTDTSHVGTDSGSSDIVKHDSPQNDITSQEIIKTAATDSEGKAYFTDNQTGEQVAITTHNDLGEVVNNTLVTFIDGNGFELFRAQHPDYVPGAPHIFAHNSEHILSLTQAPLQAILHNQSRNEQSQQGASNFVDFAQAGWEYLGCRTRQEVLDMMEGGSYIIKALSKIFTLGVSDDYLDEAKDYLANNLDENLVGHLWLYKPEGLGTSSIWVMDFKPLEDETQDGIDNNCDGTIDNTQDHNCDDNDPCSYDWYDKNTKTCMHDIIPNCY